MLRKTARHRVWVLVFVFGLFLFRCATNSVQFTFGGDLPGPTIPDLDVRQAVSSVDEQGVPRLAKGALAGVICNDEMLTYLQALFFGNEPESLLYLPSGYSLNGIHYAYLWNVAL